MERKEPLVIEVKLTTMDLWKFSMYHANHGAYGIFNVLFTAAALVLIVTTWNENAAVYRVLLIISALLFTVWQPFILYLKAARQGKTPAMERPMTLTFADEAIVVTQGEESLTLSWEDIVKAKRALHMIIIYIDGIHAYLLPDSVTGSQREAVCALLKTKLPDKKRKRI